MSDIVSKKALLATLNNDLKEDLKELLKDHLDDALFCDRVWEGWNHGTMSANDFSAVSDDDNFIDELATAILLSLIKIK